MQETNPYSWALGSVRISILEERYIADGGGGWVGCRGGGQESGWQFYTATLTQRLSIEHDTYISI